MADELTPAETALVRYLGDEPAAETIAALNDAGLRVVLAQDTPSDPAAAWEEGFDAGGTHVVATMSPPGPCGPVDPPRNPYDRAPGAVAAAPPGDEDDDATEAVLDSIGAVLLTDAPLSVRASAQRVAVLIEVDGWRLAPPAPPAGHEDEAAVERDSDGWADVDEVEYGLRQQAWSAEAAGDGGLASALREFADTLRAAGDPRDTRAAARGPRTPGSES